MILSIAPRHLAVFLFAAFSLLHAQTLPLPGQAGPEVPPPAVSPARSFVLPPLDDRKAEQLRQLVEKAMEVQVQVLVNQSSRVLWSKQESRMTVHGLGVAMRLEADDLLIVLQLTPYRKEGDLVYLLVQAQIWNRSQEKGKLNYQTAIKSTLVHPGELITFYPLGKPQDPEQAVLSIRLVVKPMDEARVQDLLAALAKNQQETPVSSMGLPAGPAKPENTKAPEKP